jgi:hypothetical protein
VATGVFSWTGWIFRFRSAGSASWAANQFNDSTIGTSRGICVSECSNKTIPLLTSAIRVWQFKQTKSRHAVKRDGFCESKAV